MLTNWLQIEMDKTLKIRQVDQNDFNFLIFYVFKKC
jgi:hypothetical protein